MMGKRWRPFLPYQARCAVAAATLRALHTQALHPHRHMSTVFNFTFVPWFRSVAPYIHKFRSQTFVVGLTGEAIAAGKLPAIAQDLALIQALGVKIVLVHGFRPQVNEQLQAKGHAAQYSQGLRITDPVAPDCAQEAAGQLRYELKSGDTIIHGDINGDGVRDFSIILDASVNLKVGDFIL